MWQKLGIQGDKVEGIGVTRSQLYDKSLRLSYQGIDMVKCWLYCKISGCMVEHVDERGPGLYGGGLNMSHMCQNQSIAIRPIRQEGL